MLLKLNNQNSRFEFADSSAYFYFDVPPGVYDLYAERVFYEDVVIEGIEVVAGQVALVDFYMVDTTTGIRDKQEYKSVPKSVMMYNYPNPFNPSTTVAFQISERSAKLALRIYDVSGKLIKTLIDAPMESGYHTIIWDGIDEKGRDVPSGVYFYKMTMEGLEQVKPMIMLK